MPTKRNRKTSDALHSMYFNCENWRSSAVVGTMSLASRGAYIELLAAAWLLPGCHLPKDEKALRRIVKPDSDAEWTEVWSEVRVCFLEDKDGLYNEKQLEVLAKSQNLHRQRVEASKEGVKARQANRVNQPSGTPSGQPTDEPSGTPSGQPNGTPSDQPNRNRKQETVKGKGEKRKRTGTEAVGLNIDDAVRDLMDVPSRAAVLCDLVGIQDWSRSYGFFFWADINYPLFEDDMTHILSGADPVVARAKDIGKVNSPGGWLRWRVKQWAAEKNVVIPSDRELNTRFHSEKGETP